MGEWDWWLAKVVLEFALKKLFGVVESRPDGPDSRSGDIGDFLVGESVDFEECDDGSVLDGEFLERVVQLLLQLVHQSGFVGVGLRSHVFDKSGSMILIGHFLEAEKATQFVFAQVG